MIAQLIGPASKAGEILQKVGWNLGSTTTGAYIGGVLFALFLVYLLGLFIQAGLKNRFHSIINGVAQRIPVVKNVYGTATKLIQLFEQSEQSQVRAMIPVLCRFGGENGASFPALLPTSETIWIRDIEHHIVMIPTAPVPVGGAIIYVPKQCVQPMDCGIDGLLDIYMSMGTNVPDFLKKADDQ